MDYAGVIIEREDGKMLFQLRDNNPRIKNPNLWSLFGGGIEQDEDPYEAAIRELKEELNLTIERKQLSLWMVVPSFKKKSYLFKLKSKKEIKNVKPLEGAKAEYLTPTELRKKKNVVKTLRYLLFFYPVISLLRK